MQHLTLDRWSRQQSPLHRLDPRAKLLAALAVLLSLNLTHASGPALYAAYFLLLSGAAMAARLPPAQVMLRGFVVLPFVGGVVVLNLFWGDPGRAWAVLARSYLSAYAVLLVLATTPFPKLLRGLESLRAPRFFLMILHFVYRYLFILYEQVQNMRRARQCRAPNARRGPLFQAAAGAVAVLFARSYARAERIHHAMLARGFQGHFVLLEQPRLRGRDWVFLLASVGILMLVQLIGGA